MRLKLVTKQRREFKCTFKNNTKKQQKKHEKVPRRGHCHRQNQHHRLTAADSLEAVYHKVYEWM